MVSSGLVEKVDVSHFRLSLHLIIAFLILSLIYWNYLKLTSFKFINQKINLYIPIFLLILIFCQITIGAFVSGMDAGQIYNSWPLMGSNYFPDDNQFINLFELEVFNNPSLVQFIHRNLAYIIILFYLLILTQILKKKIRDLYFSIKLIGIILFIQIILGILTLISGAQMILASMHQISSIFLVSSCIYFLFLNKKSNLQP